MKPDVSARVPHLGGFLTSVNIDLIQILTIAIVIFLGGFLQSAVGFGYALFAAPLILWLGVPLPKTIAIVATSALIQSTLGARNLRAQIPWGPVTSATIIRFVTTIMGIWVLKRLSGLSVGEIKLAVGCILCTIVGIQFAWRIEPTERVHPAWGILAFSSSGLLMGICGMGGPPLVLWSMAHTWSNRKTRAFLFTTMLLSIPFLIVLLGLTFGMEALWGVLIGMLLFPSSSLGAVIGIRAGNRIPKPTLRKLAFLLLLIIGLNSIIPQIMQYL